MRFEVKFKSIGLRWLWNIFLVVCAIVTLSVVVITIFANSLLTQQVKSLSSEYAYEFYSLSGSEAKNFENAAINLSESFEFKDKIEVQILNKNGDVFVSTTGFLPDEKDKNDDFEKAKHTNDETFLYTGKTSSGEKIITQTVLLRGSNGEIIGAYRWLSSLSPVSKNVSSVLFALIIVSVAILGITAISGIFFTKSIVKPIREVSNMARKIANGDFETRLTPKKNDEIGELCDTINYMASELSQAETMKNDFISSVSHELRTPLTAIRGWGETAKMSVGTDEELVSRGIDVILSEADRLSSLVEELLDFSRMQNGRLSLNTKPIDVSVLLEDAANMYTELARKQGIELSYSAPPQNSVVMGDPDRLKQVFINIIDNAVKYTEKGGLVLVVQTKEEGCVRIVVKDTGVGIPSQDIDRVKEKFFKSNKTVRGSGIGLAVADEIIKQHQGLLFIESTEGVGTTVTIVLPLYEEDLIEPEETITLTELAEEIVENENQIVEDKEPTILDDLTSEQNDETNLKENENG